MGYTPSFTPQYENGWENLPSETSPITAEALNAYDDAIENVEEYLASDNSQANLADAYDETATYEAGDYVIYGGDLYKCLEDIDEPEEWDSTKWESCLITDEMATSGGTTVIANPSGEATETLTKLQVEETIYGISGGGGNANIWTGTQAELEEVFDELEEGTQINITDDEQEVVEGGTIYSEDEQVIGLWTDNRPLYEKTISGTTASNFSTATIIADVGENCVIREFTGLINGKLDLNSRISDDNRAYTWIAQTGYQLANFAIGSFADKPTLVTVRYTKATDAPIDVVVGKKTMYIASSDCYSTEEKEVGVWIDGKPLYQKCLHYSGTATSDDYTLSKSLDSTTEIKRILDGGCVRGNGLFAPLVYIGGGTNAWYRYVFDASTHTLDLRVSGSSTQAIDAYAVIQYTKTTDTAGSGQYTPASGKAVHYSTDEQVIGTWIDGSTLYCKTIDLGSDANIAHNQWTATGKSITGIDKIIECSSTNSGGTYYPLMAYHASGSSEIQLLACRDNANASSRYVTIKYTKTS